LLRPQHDDLGRGSVPRPNGARSIAAPHGGLGVWDALSLNGLGAAKTLVYRLHYVFVCEDSAGNLYPVNDGYAPPRGNSIDSWPWRAQTKILKTFGFEKLQIYVDIPVGDISAQQLIQAGGQIFRNSNLTGSFPTPTMQCKR
jgi:hypothetical protein